MNSEQSKQIQSGIALTSPRPSVDRKRGQGGFTLTELMIGTVVFTVIMGSVLTLLVKSQDIFKTQQGVSEMDQNARLMLDFLTRDIQQSKENSLGLGTAFKTAFSSVKPTGDAADLTIVTSDTQSKIPSAALPLIPASIHPVSANDRYVELVPSGVGTLAPADVVGTFAPNEQLLMSSVRQDGSVQFDFVQVKSARVTPTNTLGLSFEPVSPTGVQTEVPFGSVYADGLFSMRPITVKRYTVDQTADANHPVFSLTVDDGVPIPIARNIMAFQVRYLQLKDGDQDSAWTRLQNMAHTYTTEAVEVTLTARTEIGVGGPQRLVTLASVVRPRFLPGSTDRFGSGGGTASWGSSVPGIPGTGPNGIGPGGPGSGSGAGNGTGGPGSGTGANGGNNGPGLNTGDWNRVTRRIDKPVTLDPLPDDPDNN